MRSTILQLGIAALVVGGFVVLTLKGSDTGSFVALVAPILGAVFVINHLDHRSDKQDEKLDTITRQTNGVLDERIKEGVKAALAERDGSVAD
jgi:membrane protein implicated in regulation of membrane protease activity